MKRAIAALFVLLAGCAKIDTNAPEDAATAAPPSGPAPLTMLAKVGDCEVWEQNGVTVLVGPASCRGVGRR